MTSAYLGYPEIEVKQLESVLFQLQVVIVLYSICKMIFLLGFVPKQETPGINPMVKFDNSVSFVRIIICLQLILMLLLEALEHIEKYEIRFVNWKKYIGNNY